MVENADGSYGVVLTAGDKVIGPQGNFVTIDEAKEAGSKILNRVTGAMAGAGNKVHRVRPETGNVTMMSAKKFHEDYPVPAAGSSPVEVKEYSAFVSKDELIAALVVQDMLDRDFAIVAFRRVARRDPFTMVGAVIVAHDEGTALMKGMAMIQQGDVPPMSAAVL